jgi:phospholipid transport system substrate-binding protein
MVTKLFSAALLSVAFAITAGAGTALANPDAEKFVANLMEQGKAILHNNDDAARRSQLHQLVMQNVDARKTALFALGAYQRGLPRQAVEQYIAAFSDYITTIYETKLEKYRDLDIKVLNSLDNGPNDATVLTQGKPANERAAKDPIIIGFRLAGAAGQYKIVDVQIAGIWISIDQRERFADMMSKNNGDIHVLTGYLADTTAQIRSGAKKV